MDHATSGTLAVLLLVSLAGCLAGDDDTDTGRDEGIGEPIVMVHDHTDHRHHTARAGLDQLSWSTLDVTLGENGFANFVLWDGGDERLALVAVDGDATGGFVIVDVADPTAPAPLGRYWVDGNSIQEVRITPSGRHALMNVQDLPVEALSNGAALSDCTVCIHVVNIEDRSAPRLVQLLPVELLGTHNLDIVEYDEGLFVFYVGQPLQNPPPDPGNHIWIGLLTEPPVGDAILVPVSQYQFDPLQTADGRSFPHDVLVQTHPVTGQRIAYISHWDGGHVLVDVTVSAVPVPLGVHADAAPSDALAVHWIMQEAAPRADGSVIAWSAPEIGSLETGSGVIRALDVTDPTSPAQVGAWQLPGDVTIPGQFLMSPHTAVPDVERGLLAVSHYHAGLWILDITDPTEPEATAFYLPHGMQDDPYLGPIWWKKPNFDPEGFGPNVYQARWDPWHDEPILWMTDRGTGLYALAYTGPVPGPVT